MKLEEKFLIDDHIVLKLCNGNEKGFHNPLGHEIFLTHRRPCNPLFHVKT